MPDTNWQKSSFSSSGGDCVEVRTVDDVVEVRESDNGEVIVRTTPTKFATLLQGIKAGEFDHHTANA